MPAERIAAYLCSFGPATAEEIARGIHVRTSEVRRILASDPRFVLTTQDGRSPRAKVFTVRDRATARDGSGRVVTHTEKVLRLLRDGRAHSHHELYGLGCVAHSRIAELRRRGHTIRCWREGDLYLYRLEAAA